MTDAPLSLPRIRQSLAAHRPIMLPADRPHAAVALLLAEAPAGPEVLFIQRATHAGDAWSGDIGFPGGRVADGETDPRQTAERETREELDLDLAGYEYLGRLDDLYGVSLPIHVSCLVYAAPQRPALAPNFEVAKVFWFPLQELLDPNRQRLESFPYRGRPTTQPVADLLGPGEPRLWGITYRLLHNFFGLLEIPFGLTTTEPSCPPPDPR
ncbi:MAG: CoA pyrophosphatase [Desulfuromonadales bacterium]|nr:CoA pyrophosphatase [Desulfuromonadales bacterium]